MLVLTRKAGEEIHIDLPAGTILPDGTVLDTGTTIIVEVVKTGPGGAKISIDAPKSLRIRRPDYRQCRHSFQ